MTRSKSRSEQHLIVDDGKELLSACLPRSWVLREYKPDYGLDFSLEVFQIPPHKKKRHATYPTLGEHLFIQLKTVTTSKVLPLKLFGRNNVEKERETLKRKELVGKINTIRFSIDTPELVTVQRMGVALPVLLVIADLSAERCYFVCLNDYIDKVLMPRFDNYTATATRTIHVPVPNQILEGFGYTALRWYSKRAKLYSAFQRFVFPHAELGYSGDADTALTLARYFVTRISNYDFWDDTEMWEPIALYGRALRRFASEGRSGVVRLDWAAINEAVGSNVEAAHQLEDLEREMDVQELWRLLALLPRTYEDVCREWYLPTAFGYLCSFRRCYLSTL